MTQQQSTRKVITLGATEHTGCYAGNTHRVIIREETAEAFVGWPDPSDSRNSEHWNPAKDKPLTYPKFAWEAVGGHGVL